jgi:hypothetical protein
VRGPRWEDISEQSSVWESRRSRMERVLGSQGRRVRLKILAIDCDYEWLLKKLSINPIIQSRTRYYSRSHKFVTILNFSRNFLHQITSLKMQINIYVRFIRKYLYILHVFIWVPNNPIGWLNLQFWVRRFQLQFLAGRLNFVAAVHQELLHVKAT